jgi:hypothetical protein
MAKSVFGRLRVSFSSEAMPVLLYAPQITVNAGGLARAFEFRCQAETQDHERGRGPHSRKGGKLDYRALTL